MNPIYLKYYPKKIKKIMEEALVAPPSFILIVRIVVEVTLD